MAASTKKPNAESRGATIPVLPLREGALFPGVIHTLHIVRECTKRAIRSSNESDGRVFCVCQRDGRIEEPESSGLYRIGVICDVLQASPLPDGSLRAVLRATVRAKWNSITTRNGALTGKIVSIEEQMASTDEVESLARECARQFQILVETHDAIPPECAAALSHVETPNAIADLLAYHLPLPHSKKQSILEEIDVEKRLKSLLAEIVREAKLLAIQREVALRVDSAFGETQREFYLREQLKAIRIELGDNESQAEIEEWRSRIEGANLPGPALERATEQLEKLERISAATPEGAAAREYLDWIVAMPWHQRSESNLNLDSAARILDERHYGIESVKERILEFLAVRTLSQGLRAPILCLVGPPGVGKSSAAASIAEAMGRKFARISLGGLRDEAEIRGHRRTYVGAMPGRILKEIRTTGVKDPVILLDEIDKMSRDWRGDPAGALLEALDPMMNEAFVDHYLELPFSLRDVVFVATANTVDGIIPALYDRLEIVEFSSYTENERKQIAERHLIPNQLAEHGLDGKRVKIDEGAIDSLVSEYSWEPGVRQLDQKIATLCRKAARRIAEGNEESIRIDADSLTTMLGPAESFSSVSSIDREGRCLGLAVSAYGGMAMPIEAAILEPNGPQPTILITGNPGDVMRESAHAASTYLRKNLVKLGIEGSMAKDVHVHVGEGAIPKDGPSAGLPMTLALISAATKRPISGALAASGEVGIHGDVRPVGGLREKLIAAKREKIARVILPRRNESEVANLPAELTEGIEIEFVSTIEEALEACAKPILTLTESPDRRSESREAKR